MQIAAMRADTEGPSFPRRAMRPLVGVIGRFHPQKNHLGFVEAATMLHRRMPEVHFVFAGNGVDIGNAFLVQAAKSAGVAEVCHFLGRRNDVPRLMAALDVLASSSIGEAFPNVVGEAMACSVPCVVTDVGDSAYIIGDTGRAVASGDMTGLAAALESLLILPFEQRRSLGEQARARVAEYFEIGKVVQMYEAFYEELADDGHRNEVNATQ
jgi:glycosyltransferase involved in cell wall biosynthesis